MKLKPAIASLLLLIVSSVVWFSINRSSDLVVFEDSTLSFDEIFELVDSTRIESGDLFSIMAVVLDSSGRYVVADYLGKKVMSVHRQSGALSVLMNTGLGPGEVMNPISLAVDDSANILIADNAARRLTILGPTGLVKGTFVISGGHIVPITPGGLHGAIFMGGYGIQDNTLIHRYDYSGKYKGSFAPVPSELVGTRMGGSICYPHFDFIDNQLFFVPRMNYTITVYDQSQSVIETKKLAPTYFVPLKKDIVEESKTVSDLDSLVERFSNIKALHTIGSVVVLQTEMPRSKRWDGAGDFLAGTDYRLDVFDQKLSPMYIGIKTPGLLKFVDKWKSILVFITELNYETHTYSLATYRMREYEK